ncbi:thiamine pyrophosphate-binding protein [Salipiger sp.]|uniref:thiamine pyrophosphate-binding protein n=1 Tax=Salipiger sp. TaxID=2078585 RepID=UPI003A9693BB
MKDELAGQEPKTMEVTAGEAIVKSLEIEGVTHVFGIIGGNILDVFDLVGRSPKMTFVGTRHEETASHMAHGFARANGQLAVCLVQNGAGLTNLATGFATAMKMHAPILGITAGPNSANVDNDGRHEIDQVGVMRPLTKWSARVPSADRLPEFLQRAFRIATSGKKGPVFLEVPTDVLKGSFEWTPPASRMSYRAKYDTMVDAEAIGEVADMIEKAARPIFVVGQGGEDAGAWADLHAISEIGDIPLCTTFGHNSAIPPTAPLSLGSVGRRGSKAAMQLLSESDLVLVIGSRLHRYTKVAYYGTKFWPEDAPIIHVNSDAETVGRHMPVELGIVADAHRFLKALNAELTARGKVSRANWRDKAVAERAKWEEERAGLAEPALLKGGKFLKPAAVYKTLGDMLPNAIYVGDVGSTTQWTFCMIPYAQPKGFIYTGSLAGLGFGMPGALGAALARPDSEVVAVLGDGAFSLSLPSLITAAEHKIPVRIVICDNAAWGAEKGHQMHWFNGHYVGADLDTGDLVAISQAIGAEAVRVNTIEELRKELEVAPTVGPKVIVAPADPDDFPAPVPHAGTPARTWLKYEQG